MRDSQSLRTTVLASLWWPIRTAASKPSSTRFTTRSEKPTSRLTSGKRVAKSTSAGTSCLLPKDRGAVSFNRPLTEPERFFTASPSASSSSITARMRS